jgi:peptidoglycan/LPS O-acetylase OafA/YrhL
LNTGIVAGSANRLAFADILRGVAALAVVVGHFTYLFLHSPELVAQLTMAEPLQPVAIPAVVIRLIGLFEFPSIGVAVFFLISGFVIPLSLEGTDTRAYLVRRFLRILPTYWIALGIGIAAVFLSANFWGKPVSLDATDYISNTILAANLFGRFDVLSVAWTLQIEVKFYLLAPLFYIALKRKTLLPLLLCALAVVGLFWNATALCDNVNIACWDHYRFSVRLFWMDAMAMVYMLIGSVIYAHYRRLISPRQAMIGVAIIFACYHAAVAAAPFTNLGRSLPYTWGLMIFGSMYLIRNRIRLMQPFRFLADISYSLYVIHPLLGYVTMRLLMAAGLPYPAALAGALALVILIAWAMHLYVEAPMIALGKRLGNAWFGKRGLPATGLATAPS